MAQIPTILANDPIKTGSTGPQASPDEFGIGEAVGQAAQSLRQDTSQIEHIYTLKAEKKKLDDLVWAGTAAQQEENYINLWRSKGENNTKSSFADDLQKLGEERIAANSSKAPSTKALQQFKLRMLSFLGTSYNEALHVSVTNHLNSAALAIDQQSAMALDSYRSARDTPNVDARQGLRNNLSQINDSIDKTFGVISPTMAQKLKEKAIVDATYATMSEDPQFARELLKSSKTLDEHERFTINEHIDNASLSKSSAEHTAFDQLREKKLKEAYTGLDRGKIDLSLYQPYYTRDKAVAQKSKDDAQIDTFNKANDFIDRIKSWNSEDQGRELLVLRNSKTAENADILDIASQRVHQSIQLQEKNPVSWLQQNNPVVAEALKRAQQSTDKTRLQTMGELYDLQLKYQGHAPAIDEVGPMVFKEDPKTGYMMAVDTKIDRKQYLGKATNDRHLMTVEEAEQNADEINKGSPQEMLNNIQQVMARYPDSKHQDIAFNDMVTLPKSGSAIKQEYQLAFLHKDSWWVKDYLGAIQHSEALKDVNSDKKKDFDTALNSNPTWLQFSHSTMGDNFQRGDEVDGFKRGIMSYAIARATQNRESPDLAIKSATQMLIASELGFTSMNGQTVMLQKSRGPGKPYRTDDEIQDYGRRMEMALQIINPSEINIETHGQSIFPTLRQPVSENLKMRTLGTFIHQRGFFQTSNDGQSATLYAMGDDKHPFELRDKQNRAFRIMFDDLPAFTVNMKETVNPLTGKKIDLTQMGLRPEDLKMVQHTNWDVMLHAPKSSAFEDSTTNWPTWFQRIQR